MHLSLYEWVRKLDVKHVILLSNKDITTKPFLYGEDYYINSVVSEMKRQGISVYVKIFNSPKRFGNKKDVFDLTKFVGEDAAVLLHNVSPIHVCKAKMIRKRVKVFMPIYFIWNKASPLHENLRTVVGSFFWQFLVDEYMVPSQIIAENLRKLGIYQKISVLPPQYSCPFCSREDNIKKMERLKRQLPNFVKAVYIGSMKPKRFPLNKIVDKLNRDLERKYELTVYTTSQVEEENHRQGNVEVKIFKRILSDEEKCSVLQESHIFIAPAKGTTMNPSISVIEAEYHGNIIARF